MKAQSCTSLVHILGSMILRAVYAHLYTYCCAAPAFGCFRFLSLLFTDHFSERPSSCAPVTLSSNTVYAWLRRDIGVVSVILKGAQVPVNSRVLDCGAQHQTCGSKVLPRSVYRCHIFTPASWALHAHKQIPGATMKRIALTLCLGLVLQARSNAHHNWDM